VQSSTSTLDAPCASLTHTCWTDSAKVKEQERELRILILGLDNAGKTTIVQSLCYGADTAALQQVEPTLGFQIHSLDYADFHLNLWDIGGQSSIRAYWRNYFEQTDGIVWVVDSSDASRLPLVQQELSRVLQQERLAGASLLIWANKQDVAGSLGVQEIAKALQLPKSDDGRHWSIHACSGITGEGLLEGMDWLVQDIGSRIFLLS